MTSTTSASCCGISIPILLLNPCAGIRPSSFPVSLSLFTPISASGVGGQLRLWGRDGFQFWSNHGTQSPGPRVVWALFQLSSTGVLNPEAHNLDRGPGKPVPHRVQPAPLEDHGSKSTGMKK